MLFILFFQVVLTNDKNLRNKALINGIDCYQANEMNDGLTELVEKNQKKGKVISCVWWLQLKLKHNLLLYRMLKKCQIFWEVVVPSKTRKKSPINIGLETHTFWVLYMSSVHLFIVPILFFSNCLSLSLSVCACVCMRACMHVTQKGQLEITWFLELNEKISILDQGLNLDI